MRTTVVLMMAATAYSQFVITPKMEQDRIAAGVRIGNQHLLGETASVEATDGEGDLGAPEVHAQDYVHPTSDRTAARSALF